MNFHSQKILLSPLFLLSLIILLVNDFYLKAQFHNFFTGKLSDIAGLFIFPLFLTAFFSKRKLLVYGLTAFLFIFWKSPFSEILIDFWNSLTSLNIGRIIDYTDFFALLILPVSYFYSEREMRELYTVSFARRILASFVVIISVFAFTATSLVKDKTIYLDEQYKLSRGKSEIENILRQNPKLQNIKIRRDDEVFDTNKYPNIEIDRKTFFVDFLLKQRFCDSERPKFSFILEPEKDFTIIRSVSIDFECKLYETNPNANTLAIQQQQELNLIFERDVIEKLRQNNSQ